MKYLDRLKAEVNSEKRLPTVLPLLPKGGMAPDKGALDSLDSTPSRLFLKTKVEDWDWMISEKRLPTVLPLLPKRGMTPGESSLDGKGSTPSGHFQKTKAEDWDWVRPISDRQPCYAGRGQGPSCFSCKSYDGRGSSWPGLCRFPESTGRVALEIDWSVVDPGHGCGCYEPDAKRIAARDKKPGFCFNDSWGEKSSGSPSCDDKPVVRPIPCREKISPVALKWLRENRQALQCNGWTMAGLYRRNKSRGIAWAGLWEQPFLKAYLYDNGVIEFECVIAGKDIIQTARPENFWRKK